MVRSKTRSNVGAINEPTKRVPAPDFPSWATFEHALTAVLVKMAVDAYLVINVRRAADAESDYYVQFAQGGRSGFVAEAVSNAFLAGRSALSPAQEEQMADLGWQFPSPHEESPTNFNREWPMPAPFDEVAALAIRTLREVYGADATSDLVYKSFPRGGSDFAQPTLGIDAMPSRPATFSNQPGASTVADLKPVVETALKSLLNLTDIAYDEDGDIPIRFGSAMVYLGLVDGHPPIVQLFSPVLWGIAASPALLSAVNDINKRIQFGRLAWTGREVMASIELPAFHITPDDIGFACLQLGSIADHFDGELQKRFGGKTMFEATGKLLN